MGHKRDIKGGLTVVATALLLGSFPAIAAAQSGTDEAARLNEEVVRLHGVGRYREAIPLAERALAIREKALGKEHPGVAQSLNNLAAGYYSLGDYARAEPLYQRALAIGEKALGPEHPDVAESLNNLAAAYYHLGDYARAEPLYQRALAIREKRLGAEHPDVAQSLNNLAELYRARGDYGHAKPLYRRAVAIQEKALGAEHPLVATSLNNLALLYTSLGDYGRADPLYRRAVAIQEKALGPEHPLVATSLNNLAGLYDVLGDYARAEPLYQRALAIQEKALGTEHPDVATSLNNLAGLYDVLGDHARAEPFYQHALAIREKALGPEHPDVANSLNNLAGLYRSLGDYARAAPLLQRAVAIHEKALGPEHPDVATNLNNLAGLYESVGDYARAEPLYQRALAIHEKALGPEHPDVATSLNNLAGLYRSLGDYARAEPLYQRALAIREKALGPEHPDVATSLNNLAVLYRSLGDYARAEPLYQRALAIKEKALGPQHTSTEATRGNVAVLYLAQGKLDAAYDIFSEDPWPWSTGLGRYHLLKRNYREAQAQFLEALEHTKKARESQHLLASYIGLGLSLEGLGKHAEAAESYRQAVELIEEQRAALSPAERTHFLGGEVGAGFPRILAYEGLVRTSTKLGQSAEALRWAEHTKARLLLEALARGRSAPGLPAERARQEEALATRLAVLYRQREVAFGKSPELFKRIDEQELPAAKKELESFVGLLRRDHPGYAALKYPQPLAATELALGAEEHLLAYEVTDTATYVWLVKGPKIVQTQTIEIPRAELTARVKQYRGLFEGVRSHAELARFDAKLGQGLYDLLFKQIASAIPVGTVLTVVPDEVLGILPFEALVVEADPGEVGQGKYGPYPKGVKYLGELYPLRYAHSATALGLGRMLKAQPSERKGKGAGSLLVVADPVFDERDSRVQTAKAEPLKRDAYQVALMRAVEEQGQLSLGRLPSTGRLAERLNVLFGGAGVKVLSGLDASEPGLRGAGLGQYSYQVFATHGILDQEVAYIREPALVLSQVHTSVSEAERDGFLTLSEVMGLELDAEVVALTACNTGVGKQVRGEGVMGMGRAFQYAGAKNVVMSLWSVDEESTVLLAERFFGYVKGGMGSLAALARARADVRQAGYEHPFFWAPFILVGEG